MTERDPRRKLDFSYKKILAQKLQSVPVWRELAEACDDIFGREVDDRRRRLEKIRDSVKYRRGDVLTNVLIKPDIKKALYIDTGQEAVFTEPIVAKTATVKNVIKNIAYRDHPDTTDYLELSTLINGREVRWLKAFQSPQERDALLKNARIMGFDFFNTKLSDEDLQRLYEFVQIYWNEHGTSDNFMKFIGFIKNARFDLVPLWSEEDPEVQTYEDLAANPDKDVYPKLVAKPRGAQSVANGGSWYLTSHVEIRYDISQFDQFYTIKLDDLETLFYYFSPIILVLERIIGSLDVESDLHIISVNDLTQHTFDLALNDTFSSCNQYRYTADDFTQHTFNTVENGTKFQAQKTVLNPAAVTVQTHNKYDLLSTTENNLGQTYYFSLTGAPNTVHYEHCLLDLMNPGTQKGSRIQSYQKHDTTNISSQSYSVIETTL